MKRLRPPPPIKVLEAAAAIADGRVRILSNDGKLLVARARSSGRSIGYRVVVETLERWEGRVYNVYSDDNGTIYRGYVGYPIISSLMIAGRLPRDERVESLLKGINWHELNSRYKNYGRVIRVVIQERAPNKGDSRRLESFMRDVLSRIRSCEFYFTEDLLKKVSSRLE